MTGPRCSPPGRWRLSVTSSGVSTAYHPRANKRAEVAVKSAKRLIRGNTSQTGTLHTDDLARAILQHRNTPCPLTGLSPAEIVFGRVLRDFIPLQPGKFVPREEWRLAAHQREQEQLERGSKALSPFKPGHHVQSKTGPQAVHSVSPTVHSS